jgi:chromosome segregation ATPase
VHAELASSRSALRSAQAEAADRLTEVLQAQRDQRTWLDQTQRMQLDIDRLNQELRTYSDKVIGLTQRCADAEARADEAAANRSGSQLVIDKAVREREALNQQNMWLEQQLHSKTEEMLKARQELTEMVCLYTHLLNIQLDQAVLSDIWYFAFCCVSVSVAAIAAVPDHS